MDFAKPPHPNSTESCFHCFLIACWLLPHCFPVASSFSLLVQFPHCFLNASPSLPHCLLIASALLTHCFLVASSSRTASSLLPHCFLTSKGYYPGIRVTWDGFTPERKFEKDGKQCTSQVFSNTVHGAHPRPSLHRHVWLVQAKEAVTYP